jgi:hypothetical protein
MRGGSNELSSPLLKFSNALQRHIPSCLELRCHESIVGIDCLVATGRAATFVLRLLDLEIQRAPEVILLAGKALRGRNRRLDRWGFKSLEELTTNSLIGTQTAERDATLRAVIDEGSLAAVPRDNAADSAIRDVEHASTSMTAEQPGEQTPTTTARLA